MSLEGGLLGLGAAVAWGTADMGASFATRRVGAARTTAVVVPASSAILVTLFVLSGTPLPADLSVLLGSVVVGAIASFAYFVGYAAFRAGPVSIVAPILSAGGGLTVLLAIAFLGERPTALNLVAAAIATAGVVLAAFVRHQTSGRVSFAGPGVRYALVVLFIGGVMPIISSLVIRQAGWLPALTTARVSNTVVVGTAFLIVALLGIRRSRRPDAAGLAALAVDDPTSMPLRRAGRRTWLLLAAIAVAEVFAVTFFYAGISFGPTWLVGLTSSFGPLIVISGGIFLFGERPRRVQWAGVALILVSVLVLAAR
jgi:drug/metabolite transporter (DMT)-like permease